MDLNSILIGSEDPKALADFYTKLFGDINRIQRYPAAHAPIPNVGHSETHSGLGQSRLMPRTLDVWVVADAHLT